MPYKDIEKRKAYKKEWNKTHKYKGTYPGRSVKRREADPAQWILWHIKHAAKKRNLEFNLTHDDIIVPDKCPILGIPLVFGIDKKTGQSPSVDRVDNSKGYIKGNIQIISSKANSYKSDMTKEDIGKLYEYVLQHTS